MASMVHGLEAEYFGRINFVYLDADDRNTQAFQQQLGFFYQPEVYLLDEDGNVLKKWVGFTSEEEFEEEFAKYLQ
jgi:thioredoxin-like negative regulator of GroEL